MNEEFSQHISTNFNSDLEDMRNHILAMGGMVEKQVSNAVQALVECDSSLAAQVLVTEKQINGFERQIDEECMRVLALRQPAASDLRLVVAVTKANVDLERVGDEASKIAKMAIKLSEQEQTPGINNEVRHIGDHVGKMLHEALDAFARFDVEQATSVVRADENVDVEYDSAMRQLMTFMMEDPRTITRVLNVMWSLRALERVGDHARNVAEQVIFSVKGEDVRHRSLEEFAAGTFLNDASPEK